MVKASGRLALAGGLLALGALVAVPAFAPRASADDEQVAKGLGKNVEWINGPALDQFESLRGRVIFIDLWGIN